MKNYTLNIINKSVNFENRIAIDIPAKYVCILNISTITMKNKI